MIFATFFINFNNFPFLIKCNEMIVLYKSMLFCTYVYKRFKYIPTRKKYKKIKQLN